MRKIMFLLLLSFFVLPSNISADNVEEGEKVSLIDQGYMLVGSLPGHVVLIVGYRKDNNAIYYCMDTDLPKKGSYGSYVEIKQVQFEDIFKFNIK